MKKTLEWFVKEVVRANISPVSKMIGAGLACLLAPALLIWWRRGLNFFSTDQPVPGWRISLVGTFLILLGAFATWQTLRLRRARPAREVWFRYGDLDWVLTSGFGKNWRHVMVDQMSPAFLRTAVQGPFCRVCKVDVGYLTANGLVPEECARCGIPIEPSDGMSVDGMRRVVYLEAQATARRQIHSPSSLGQEFSG